MFIKLPMLLWIPAVVISLVSFASDRKELSIRFRLSIHLLCAFFVAISLVSTRYESGFFILPFLIFFIAGTANMYNFMDGINGIIGITAIIAFGFTAFYADRIGADQAFVFLSMSVAATSLGFLVFNFPKAKVFMGDVGSILLGFVFSVLIVMISNTFLDFICMAGFLLLFYFDEVSTMALRLRQKESLFKSHRKHLYQILTNEIGLSHWKVSVTYGVIQIIICMTIILISGKGYISIFLFYLCCAITLFFISKLIRMRGSAK
ncbi:MAG: UDP-N-acetylmuramyl pentapeptide phosphotransferase [Pseudomonadota bacterium]